MTNKIIFYPAIFHNGNIGYSVSFPDLPGCFTEGDTLEEAYKNAFDSIGLYCQNKDGNFIFPDSSNIEKIKLEADEFIVLIQFNVLEYLKKNSSTSVKKTLTIPSWLDYMAREEGINFSNVLQKALKENLHLK